MADGPITSSLAVNTDPAGNTFTPVAGTTVTLDQDAGEQAALALSFVDTTIQTAQSTAVHFTVGGLDAEDTAVVTFTDHLGGTKTASVSSNGSATADLSGLADGAITASMQVASDAAGNSFLPVNAMAVATTIQPGLIGDWQANNNANDSSSTANNGTFSGSYAPGISGPAFNLSTGNVSIADNDTYSFGPNFSAGFWFNANGQAGGTFIGQDTGGGNQPKWFIDYGYSNPGAFELQFVTTSGTILTSNQVSLPTGWNQLTLTKNSNVYTFYLNGVNIGTQLSSQTFPDPTVALSFGLQEPNVPKFNGLLQDVVLYNRTLSASEVATLDLVTATATLDRDVGEQAALALSFVDTTIQTAQSTAVHFTVGGLDAEDTAVVTFTDHLGGTKTASVSSNGSATANLSALADGTITASMQVATDAAGNSFTPVVASNSATLDQVDRAATLSFTDTLFGAAGATAVHFLVGGLASDDSGSITFTDAANNTKTVNIVNGTPVSGTVDLSGLTDGTVTASLSASDAAGNTFNANSSNTATLDQDSGEQAALKLTVGNTDIGAAAAAVAFTIAGLDARGYRHRHLHRRQQQNGHGERHRRPDQLHGEPHFAGRRDDHLVAGGQRRCGRQQLHASCRYHRDARPGCAGAQ